MANTLVKDPLFGGPGSGGDPNGPDGSGGAGGGGGGGGGGGSAVQLGVPGTACYESALVRITEQWPMYEVVYVYDLALFRVTSPDGRYVYHTKALCSSGYLALTYEIVRSPAYEIIQGPALPTDGA